MGVEPHLVARRGSPVMTESHMQTIVDTVAPRVHVAAELRDDFWVFTAADNGIGIDSRHHQQIFEPFKRLHAKSSDYGARLGLAICRRIVDGFGGQIGATSSPGQGSTFTFTAKVNREDALQ